MRWKNPAADRLAANAEIAWRRIIERRLEALERRLDALEAKDGVRYRVRS